MKKPQDLVAKPTYTLKSGIMIFISESDNQGGDMPEATLSPLSLQNWISRKASSASSTKKESTGGGFRNEDGAQPAHVDDVFGAFTQAAINQLKAVYPDEVPDMAALKKAIDILNIHGRAGYQKLIEHKDIASLQTTERMALEAVIRFDGTRPSFLIRNKIVPLNHPMMGGWRDTIHAATATIRRLTPSIGRIQPVGGGPSNFFGTGSLVEAGQGLVLTNYHVHEAILGGPLTRWTRNEKAPNRINVTGGVVIDFDGEINQMVNPGFRVVEIILPKGSSSKNGGFDVAVLRIEPIDMRPMPQAIPLVGNANAGNGAIPSLCMIGFPGRPDVKPDKIDPVDWNWVISTLFGNLFGLKRLAPGGVIMTAGSLSPPYATGVFGHDMSSLGGSSGSLIHHWLAEDGPGVALHFAGAHRITNLSHGLVQMMEELIAVGVPVG